MFNKLRRRNINRIIEDNLDYLVRFAYYRLSNRVEAEDVVYEAVLKILEREATDIQPGSVRMYLFRTVHNLCLDRSREKGREPVSLESIDIEDTSDSVLDLEEVDRINACLERLPSREADVIRMNVIDGLSFVEISAILSIPQSTAKSRYKSGMEKLRKQFVG